MSKLLFSSAMALSLIAAGQVAAQQTPSMNVEIVTQDATDLPDNGHVLVPLMMMVILVATAIGSDSTGGTPVVAASDERLKTDITRIGATADGLPLYEFRYIGQSQLYRGVMAQDVLQHRPEAIGYLPGGYMSVDYGMLGIAMLAVD